MSRTHRDLKSAKNNCAPKKSDPLTKNYLSAKQDGFHAESEEDLCPECRGLINFTNGFLACTDCDWTNFETEELDFQEFIIHEAI